MSENSKIKESSKYKSKEMDNWCTIESDPGVFTELIQDLGVKGIEVEEVYALNDQDYLASLQPIYGFIFLFKWTGQPSKRPPLFDYDPELYFAKQVITNACATQALLSVLLNIKDKLQLSPELEDLRSFGIALDAYSRGLILGESENIRKVHNSFARPEPFVQTGSRKATEKDDVFHFVAYIHHNNRVYELDGLQEGPIMIAENVSENAWVNEAINEIQSRIESYAMGEIKFNLLVLKASQESILESKRIEKESKILGLLNAAKNLGIDVSGISVDLSSFNHSSTPIAPTSDDPHSMLNELAILTQEREALAWEISSQKAKLKAQKEENERRKQNYLPLIFDLFKLAAETGHLEYLYNEAIRK